MSEDKRALYLLKRENYSAVIPHIQNVYGPEKDHVGWFYGFKYQSGVFEFFTYATRKETQEEHDKMSAAIESYYTK